LAGSYLGRRRDNRVTDDAEMVSLGLETEAETAAIPPAMLIAIFANTEHHVGLCLRAESIFCNPIVSASTKVFFIRQV
jgi:hypothetical protein